MIRLVTGFVDMVIQFEFKMLTLQTKSALISPLRAAPNCGMRPTFPRFLTALVLVALAWAIPDSRAVADPASTIQTLMIVDQGDFLSFQWSFYYVDFPPRFVLREKQDKEITLTDPATLYDNLEDIVSVGFDLRINGRSVPPDKVSRLSISPNRICTVTLIYRGVPGGKMELRAPILQYLPPTAMVNYEILRLNQSSDIITGNLMAHAGPFQQAITYRELGRANEPAPQLESEPFALFRTELKTAWVNSNWLLLSALLFLVYPVRRALVPLLVMVGIWIALCFAHDIALPFSWTMPAFVPAVTVALTGLVAWRCPGKESLMLAAVIAAALLNAAYDLQQVRWTPEDRAFPCLVALELGFTCGLALASLVWAVLGTECRRMPEYSAHWAPKIAVVIAVAALLLPVAKLIYR